MGARPFRFAVQGTTARSGAEWRALARSVEDLGYSTLFVADHYLGPGPAAVASSLPPTHVAPIAAMATAAAVTSTLRVGCRVFCIDYHVPVALAKEAATVDLLSDGRLELGIGAGWNEIEYDAMGLRFGRPGDRVDKLEEVVALLKAHWSGEQLDVAGTHVTARGFAGRPRPAQRPRPPIMVGGSKRRVLSLAAREADIVSINNVSFTAVDGRSPGEEAVHRLDLVRDAAGDRWPELEIESSPYFADITDDPAAAARRIVDLIGVPGEGLLDHPNVLIGTEEEIVERLEERRERFGVNYVTVQQDRAEAFAPVVARLAGR